MKRLFSLSLFLFLLFFGFMANAASDKDALWSTWTSEKEQPSARMLALHNLIWEHYMSSNQDSGIILGEKYLDFAKTNGEKREVADALLTLGRIYGRKGSSVPSKKFLDKSLRIAEEIGDSTIIGECYSSIGANAYGTGEFASSYKTLLTALSINKKTGNTQFQAYDYGNLGNLFAQLGMYEEAQKYYTKMQEVNVVEDNKLMIAGNTSNQGIIFLYLGDTAKGLEYKLKGLQLSIEGDFLAYQGNNLDDIIRVYIARNQLDLANTYLEKLKTVSVKLHNAVYYSAYHTEAGIIFLKQKKYNQAIDNCKKGYELALESQFPESEKAACQCLYETYKALGKQTEALHYFELLDGIKTRDQKDKMRTDIQRDEFKRQLVADSLVQEETDRLVQEAHEEEMRAKEKTRNIALGAGGFLLLLAGGFYSRMRYIRKSRANLQVEKDRSENLLLNILPEEIAQELKIYGKAEARDFDMVSILFTDFKGFTEASAKMSAGDLVSEINFCFEAFDGIMEKYGIEKIKTIGDAYMAAGGLPVPNDDSVKNTVLAALEMQDFIIKRKSEVDSRDSSPSGRPGGVAFEMRVGIHTGPVVAGIVGVKKFQYDIWGDTVNTASRMESSGDVGKVNISQATYELLKDDTAFAFESRGKIEAKGKGEIEMWFVAMSH